MNLAFFFKDWEIKIASGLDLRQLQLYFRKMTKLIFLLSTFFMLNTHASSSHSEFWKIKISLQNEELPFILERQKSHWIVHNQKEKIYLKVLSQKKSKWILEFPLFENTLELLFKENIVTGTWTKKSIPENLQFELKGEKVTTDNRLTISKEIIAQSFPERWKMTFIEEGESSDALGTFSYENGLIQGSILTPTGDYRFLEGMLDTKSSLVLYGFDGQFAFVIKAQVKNKELEGTLKGGKSWITNFKASAKEDYFLPDPYQLTKMKSGKTSFQFKGKSIDGKSIDLSLKKRNKKLTLLQIMGSWCPNCMDEANFLSQWSQTPTGKNVEIIAMAFEKLPTEAAALTKLKKWKKELNITYPIVLASHNANEKKVLDVLPEIEKHVSYPSIYFLNESGEVIKIHTGFSGPATGRGYEDFQDELEKFVVIETAVR